VYDRIGRLQDWQRLYEGPAVAELVAHADFEHARSVFELGCGTGAMALSLFDDVLPADATYTGVDVSSRMVQLASKRLAPFADRATVVEVGGRAPLPGDSDRFDRVVALYVFDLLAEPLAQELLAEAERLLTPDGRLCLVSLTHGTTAPSRVLCSLWNRVWRVAPALLGGCRPIDLLPLLDGWEIEHVANLTAWAVPSQVVVAAPAGTHR
jgi:ubiquinone/menaquinone biosynthesis C-methylase UbiE